MRGRVQAAALVLQFARAASAGGDAHQRRPGAERDAVIFQAYPADIAIAAAKVDVARAGARADELPHADILLGPVAEIDAQVAHVQRRVERAQADLPELLAAGPIDIVGVVASVDDLIADDAPPARQPLSGGFGCNSRCSERRNAAGERNLSDMRHGFLLLEDDPPCTPPMLETLAR